MRIAIIALGSRGDVQPYIALGLGLKNAGHTVRLIATQDFEVLVKSHGLEFWFIRGNSQESIEGKEWREVSEKGESRCNYEPANKTCTTLSHGMDGGCTHRLPGNGFADHRQCGLVHRHRACREIASSLASSSFTSARTYKNLPQPARPTDSSQSGRHVQSHITSTCSTDDDTGKSPDVKSGATKSTWTASHFTLRPNSCLPFKGLSHAVWIQPIRDPRPSRLER